jgi:hypothetical protein
MHFGEYLIHYLKNSLLKRHMFYLAVCKSDYGKTGVIAARQAAA